MELEKIEDYVPADEDLSNNDTFHVDNALRSKESMMENISLMEDIMPFAIYKVIKTCPKVKIDNKAVYKQPKKLEEMFGEEGWTLIGDSSSPRALKDEDTW